MFKLNLELIFSTIEYYKRTGLAGILKVLSEPSFI